MNPRHITTVYPGVTTTEQHIALVIGAEGLAILPQNKGHFVGFSRESCAADGAVVAIDTGGITFGTAGAALDCAVTTLLMVDATGRCVPHDGATTARPIYWMADPSTTTAAIGDRILVHI